MVDTWYTSAFGIVACCHERAPLGSTGLHGNPAATSVDAWTLVQSYSDIAFVLLAGVYVTGHLAVLVFGLSSSLLEATWNRTF